MPTQQTINITIRGMNGMFSTMGLHLESGEPLCPKLKPLEVISISTDHPIFDSDASAHIEITRLEANRPYFFKTPEDLIAYQAGDGDSAKRMAQAAAQIGTSRERTAKLREQNKRQRDALIAKGINPDPVQVDIATQAALNDQSENLGPVNSNNAVTRDDDHIGDGVAPPTQPKARKRRGSRT